MNSRILYLHGRPSAHPLHQSLASSLGVVSKHVDEDLRWQDQGFGALKNFYAWIKNALNYKKYSDYDFILVDGLHFSPIIAKKFGVLPKKIKIIAHMGNQLPYFMLAKQIPSYSRFMHRWLFKNYDFIFCEGEMIKEIIVKVNPNIKTPLLTVFTGPSTSRIEVLRKLKPEFKSYNVITVAGGPGEARIFYKGLDIMIGGIIKASKHLPLLKYYILGEWSVDDIKNLSLNYTQDELKHVFFVGNQPDINDYLRYMQNSDLSIHLARGDAFPGSTTEAMHAGVPVILSNYTGTQQILKEVSPDLIISLSEEELAKKINWFFDLSLIEKTDLSVKVKKVAEKFTETTARELYRKTFEDLEK